MLNQGIYQDGISAQEVTCEVVLSEHKLYLYFKDQAHELLIWDLKSLATCRLSANTIYVTKGADPVQTLSYTGAIAKQIYEAYQNPLPETKPGAPKNVKLFFALCALIVLMLAALFYFFAMPWLAEKAVVLIPQSTEITLGNKLSETYLREEKINDSATYYCNAFVKRLNFNTAYPIHVYVVESAEINAFAVPGGAIFIYSGLLSKMNSYEELVALLGHESTHIIKRHSLKSMTRGIAAGMIISTIFGDVSAISAWLLSKADQFKQLDYSRDLETEADLNGLKIMQQNKVSPGGMLALLEILKKESTEEPALMKYLSTHPDRESRISAVSEDPTIKNVFPENKKLENIFVNLKDKL